MKNLTVRKRIIFGFSAVIITMAMLSVVASVLLYEIKGKATSIATDTWPGLYLSSQIGAVASDSVASVYRLGLGTDGTRRQQSITDINADQTKLDELIKDYERTSFRETDRRLLASIKSSRADCEGAYKPITQNGRAFRPEETDALLESRIVPACKEFLSSVNAEIEDNKENGDTSNQRVLSAVSSAQTAVVTGLFIGFIFALTSGYILVRAINNPLSKLVSSTQVMRTGNLSERVSLDRHDEFGLLADGLNSMATDLAKLIGQVRESGVQISSSSAQLGATSQEHLSTANEIAATTSEIGATAKQISVTSKELVQTMKTVAQVAERSAALAGSGQAGLGRMKVTVQQIVEASSSIHNRLEVLNEKAGNIGAVVTTIVKVADQTNLLSLNAAIEAEKAGEAGRGFAVVATEIRRLADQTATATIDIEKNVKEMQSAVAAGVMGMDKFSEEVRKGSEVVQQVHEELSQIISQVQTLTPNFEAVTEGMQSQSLGAQQISEALSQLSDASKQTAESMRQSNQAVEQLNDAARGLKVGIARFNLAATS
ncbi:MAG: methyl-accepting chemotaxis protein [Candidatus Acidiferrales bacterium]